MSGRADEDRAGRVLKWMFLRLRDVDTSLCFTAAAAAAVTTMMGACRAIVASSRRVYENDSYNGRSLPHHQSVSSLSSLLLHAAAIL